MIKLLLLAVFTYAAHGAPSASLSRPMLDGRIVGGVNTTIEEIPYIVSLQRQNLHYCGGSIVTPTWVISAAHCLLASPVSIYSVRAGSTTRNSGGEVVAVATIIYHARYNSQTIDFDIGLVRLTSPITIDVARTIPLAAFGPAPPAGSVATVSGWGALTEGGSSPMILQTVDLFVVSHEDCRIAYGNEAITDQMFCAGISGVGGKDACQGDSGGPVVIDDTLFGLVSWGRGCARPTHPGVKTCISSLRPWIDDVLAGTYRSSDVIEF